MVKNNDFVEIEYIGRIKDDNLVFDTSDEKVAKESGIFDPKMTYGPIVVCIGQGHLLKGLDEDLNGKEIGKDYEVEIQPENAFGKKDAKLLKIVPTSILIKQKINPQPGLQLNIDGMIGTIKTVSGGRTVVDFNHPFSSKVIVYKYKLNKLVEDDQEKLKSFLILAMNVKPEGFELEIKENKAKVKTKDGVNLDDNAKKLLSEKAIKLIPNLKEVIFE